MNRFIFILMLAFIVCSCRSTKVVEVDVPKVEKEYIVKSDTVHQIDSVYISNDRYILNDTVYVTKINEKFKYIYKVKTDTLVRTDTITIVNTEQIKSLNDENEALKNVNYFYRKIGLMMLIIIGFMALYNFIKRT